MLVAVDDLVQPGEGSGGDLLPARLADEPVTVTGKFLETCASVVAAREATYRRGWRHPILRSHKAQDRTDHRARVDMGFADEERGRAALAGLMGDELTPKPSGTSTIVRDGHDRREDVARLP